MLGGPYGAKRHYKIKDREKISKGKLKDRENAAHPGRLRAWSGYIGPKAPQHWCAVDSFMAVPALNSVFSMKKHDFEANNEF